MTAIKSIAYLSVFLLALSGCHHSERDAKEQNPFLTTLQTHLDAIKTSNLLQLGPTVAESVIMISPNGDKMESKKVFMDFHKNWFELDRWKWEGKVLRAENSDSLGYALIQYNFIQQDALGNTQFNDNEYLILIFKNSNTGWQLVHDQNTRILE